LPGLTYLKNVFGGGGQFFNNPIIDNIMFGNSVDLIIKSGQVKRCKVITGYNSDEFSHFLSAYNIINKENNFGLSKFDFDTFSYWIDTLFAYYPSYPLKHTESFLKNLIAEYFSIAELIYYPQIPVYVQYLNRIMSDFWFVCQSFEIAEAYSMLNLDAYVYEFKFKSNQSKVPSYLGTAAQGDELVYTFGIPSSNKVTNI
jgi:carboxylesterase type B